MKKKGVKESSSSKIIFITISIIIAIGIVSFLLALFLSKSMENISKTAHVMVVKVEGPIYTTSSNSLFASEVAVSDVIVQEIKDAERFGYDAILLEINSPGGTVVASEEIANAVKAANITTVAWIREVGASGGYWVASSADIVVADPMAITGSIGVISSYLQFEGLMEKYGIGYERLVGGEFKDIGSPYKNLTEAERGILQEKIDNIHTVFIQEIATNRGMSEEEVRKIATGLFYFGTEAKELGLVDELGGKDRAIEILKQELNVEKIKLKENKKEPSLLDAITKIMYTRSFYTGKGIGSAMLEQQYDKTNIMLI